MKKVFVLSISIIGIIFVLSGAAYAHEGSNIDFRNKLSRNDYNAQQALRDLCRYTDKLEERITKLERKIEELERKVK